VGDPVRIEAVYFIWRSQLKRYFYLGVGQVFGLFHPSSGLLHSFSKLYESSYQASPYSTIPERLCSPSRHQIRGKSSSCYLTSISPNSFQVDNIRDMGVHQMPTHHLSGMVETWNGVIWGCTSRWGYIIRPLCPHIPTSSIRRR